MRRTRDTKKAGRGPLFSCAGIRIDTGIGVVGAPDHAFGEFLSR
jgi:hypothetical protein